MALSNSGGGLQRSQSQRTLPKNQSQSFLKQSQTSGMGTDQDPYGKVSLRQKGKQFQGSLVKGATSAAFIKKTMGSVPSKFETVVYMHTDVKKQGFGSNSDRFSIPLTQAEAETEPGPGSYLSKDNLNYMLKRSDSYSRLGYGNGFLSRDNRFQSSNVWYSKFLPGPGSYQSAAHQESLMGASTMSKFTDKYKARKNNAIFIEHKSQSRLDKKENNPGPGSYKIEQIPSANQLPATKSAGEAAFKSTTMKSEYLNWNVEQRSNPGVGNYDFERDNLLKKTMSTYNVGQITSNFKLPSQCKRVKVNVYDPFQNVEQMDLKVPGPGSYNVEKDTISYKNIEKLTTGMFSSMFQKPAQTFQIGGSPLTKSQLAVPGPGFYENRNQFIPEKKAVSGSVFKSDVIRDIIDLKRGPGPAYYKQIVDDKKPCSFGQNPHSKWV